MGKYKRVISKLETIKNELPNHENIDTTLKYFKLAKATYYNPKKPYHLEEILGHGPVTMIPSKISFHCS